MVEKLALHPTNILTYVCIFFLFLQIVIVYKKYVELQKEKGRLKEKLQKLNQSMEEMVKKRTVQLAESNQQLLKAQNERTRLVANIAHDIGSPLAGIHTYLQMIKAKKEEVELQEVLPQLLERIEYVKHLNNNLFVLSQLENGDPFQLEGITVERFIEDTFSYIQTYKKFEQVSIRLGKVDTRIENKEVIIYIDRLRIKQVVDNFVYNAMKFSKISNKMIIFHCTIRCLVPNQYELVVKIEDNGIGIAPHVLPHIFDRNYKKSKGSVQGNGLGLAIAKDIMERHGGEVGGESQLGQGSTFYFTLPAYVQH